MRKSGDATNDERKSLGESAKSCWITDSHEKTEIVLPESNPADVLTAVNFTLHFLVSFLVHMKTLMTYFGT